MKKISIIVPVYNLSQHIEKCLLSLVCQDMPFHEYEIIVINDGSTDNSKKVILDLQNQYPNIVYFEQENKGVSVARNAGLDIAQGEFIFFVDGDDTLYCNVLNTVYQNASSKKIDLMYLKIECYDEKGNFREEVRVEPYENLIMDGISFKRRGFVFSLYKKTIVENIRFVKDIPIGEDALFNIMVHLEAKRCIYLDLPVYKYLIRTGSALHSKVKYSESAFLGYLKTLKILKDLQISKKGVLTDSQMKFFERPFYKVAEMALVSNIIPAYSIKRLKKLKKEISDLELDFLIPQIVKSVPMYNKHWALFFGYYFMRQLKQIMFITK